MRDLVPQDINRLFDRFFGGWAVEPFSSRFSDGLLSFAPAVNVAGTEKEITVSAELPGMEEKDVEVSLAGDVLILKGEKQASKEEKEKEKNYRRIERSYGAFTRAIPLGAEVDPTQVQATFKKGVLTVTLPKTPAAKEQSRRITIETE